MTIRLMLLAAIALLVSSCSAEGGDAKDPPAATASGSASAADEQAIRAQVARWLALIKSKDAAGIAAMYTEDGAFMPPNAAIGKGHSAIEQNWSALMGLPGFDLTFAPEQIDVSSSGDMALDRGTYRMTVAPDGNQQVDTGKYVVVWRKVGGEWKAAADIINSDLPVGAADPA